MELVKKFNDYFLLEKQVNAFYHDELNPKFWTKHVSKDGSKEKWTIDPIIKKKLLKIGNEFYDKFGDAYASELENAHKFFKNPTAARTELNKYANKKQRNLRY